MWHASTPASQHAERILEEALRGVGDASRGEWTIRSPQFLHLQRRLTVAEDAVVGPLRDIRGTEEARRLLAAVPSLPPDWVE